MVRLRCSSETGFTLIEVLVALAIIAFALLAALRASGQGVNNVSELRTRLLATWVAENLLTEHRARGDWLSPGIHRGTARQGNTNFVWTEEVVETSNPAFRKIDVFIFADLQRSYVLAHLTGFLAQPPGTPK